MQALWPNFPLFAVAALIIKYNPHQILVGTCQVTRVCRQTITMMSHRGCYKCKQVVSQQGGHTYVCSVILKALLLIRHVTPGAPVWNVFCICFSSVVSHLHIIMRYVTLELHYSCITFWCVVHGCSDGGRFSNNRIRIRLSTTYASGPNLIWKHQTSFVTLMGYGKQWSESYPSGDVPASKSHCTIIPWNDIYCNIFKNKKDA